MCDVIYISPEHEDGLKNGVPKSVDVDLGLVEDEEGGEMRKMWFHWDSDCEGRRVLMV
jgi:hypothetical protein